MGNKSWLWFVAGAAIVCLIGLGVAVVNPWRGAWGYGAWMPHMGNGWGFFPFGWMMLGMWLIPLLLVILTVLGILALFRLVFSNPPKPSQPAKTCSSCGKPLQTDWKHCPYCGASQNS